MVGLRLVAGFNGVDRVWLRQLAGVLRLALWEYSAGHLVAGCAIFGGDILWKAALDGKVSVVTLYGISGWDPCRARLSTI